MLASHQISYGRQSPARPSAVVTCAKDTNVLGRIGSLEVCLAESEADIAAAQALRYQIFHTELGAQPGTCASQVGHDRDRMDAICDHLIVIDRKPAPSREAAVVGTYRLLLHDRAREAGGFYSDGEFELSTLASNHPEKRFLELGRSCVLPQYRSRRTIELLWQGIWAYCNRHEVDVMAGCASFSGTIPARHALALSFLHHHCQAVSDWRVKALPSRHNSMDFMPAEGIAAKAAISAMPPLIKGYLRLGARVGDGCVVDEQFNTTDVLIILPCESISQRYIDYYGRDATRFAA